ncbi:MAG TPA: tetratricopeptide repeat protein [Acidimicrobiia bacterium]|nr:tetratricopeptide repeat protein [Acidimicrobiia bacterium]
MESNDDVAAEIDRASALLDIDRPEDAERVVLEGLNREPQNPDLLELLVRALYDQNQMDAARSAAERLLAAAPNQSRAHLRLAVVLHATSSSFLGVRRRVLPLARQAAVLAPRDPEVLAVLGYALLDAAVVPFIDRHLKEAEEVARQCVELAPAWDAAHLLTAEVASRRGRRSKAVSHVDRALELSPSQSRNIQTAFDLGRRHQRALMARRLAATNPTDLAMWEVVLTHQITPNAPFMWMTLVVAGTLVGATARDGNLGLEDASALWVIGPVLGVVIAWSLIWFRRRRLAGLDPEIRGVVLYWERMWRWARVGGAIVLGVLPILWIPASIAGGHPSAWAIAWLYAGGLAGMTVRPRHR